MKSSQGTQSKEHKASNADGITNNAGVNELFFQIPQVFAFVFFFVAFVTISPSVLRVKILICQQHRCFDKLSNRQFGVECDNVTLDVSN